jgi:hypothetical protein
MIKFGHNISSSESLNPVNQGSGIWFVYAGTPVVRAIFRDYLGSITHLRQMDTDNSYEYSFDAYGRRRDKDDWAYTISGDTALFADRGFTGHEHLDEFGLINMNARLGVYPAVSGNPVVGRFLSPDNYISDSSNTHNLTMAGFSYTGVGSLVAGGYWITYMGFEVFTGYSLGDRLDQWLDPQHVASGSW